MERKHKIESARMVVPMTITFRKLDDDSVYHGSALVDYAQESVTFTGDRFPGVDYDDLEQELLSYLRPESPPQPNIPADVLEKVAKVRSGDYQSAFTQQLPEIVK